MKKTLAILLTFILTFSCFSILGMSTVVAAENDGVLLELDLSSSTKWSGNRISTFDDDGDGTKEAIRLNNTTGTSNLNSSTFVLTPGKEYKLSFEIRIPAESIDFADYLLDGTFTKTNPKFAIFQPGNTAAGEKIAAGYGEGKNDYSYKYEKYGTVRRPAFSADWQVGSYPTMTVEGLSGFNSQFYNLLKDDSGNVISPNVAFKDWTTITSTFTAIDDEASGAVGDQVAALYFTIGSGKKGPGLMYDIKNVKLIDVAAQPEVPEGYEQGLILREDFEETTDVNTVIKDGSNTDWADFEVTDTEAANGNKSAKIYAPFVYLYLPLNKSLLKANTEYTVSFNWKMLEYTETKPRELKNIRLVGWNPSTGEIVKEAAKLKQYSTISSTGDWVNSTFKFTISDLSAYEEFVFCFVPNTADASAAEDTIYIDDILIADATYVPETPEEPEEPESNLPYLSVVDTDGNQHKYGADIGAKVEVKANEDGSNTFTLTYDDMDSVNLFEGWYDGDTFLSADTTFIAPEDVNKNNVKAKILCRSVITGGLGFESYTEKTSLRVSPEDENQNLHNIAPFDDKWGQMYKTYQQADEWCMTIQSVYGAQRVKYTTDYVDGKYTTDYVNVTPYGGNSMFNFAARGRAVVRKLDNLKPNTNYELSFYVYNTSDWDFLNKAIVTDSYEISVGNLYPSTAKVYSAYVAGSKLSDKNGKNELEDKNLVQKWSKINISFKTDSDDTYLYLHLAQANGNDSGSTSNIFLDDLTCTETVLGYTGNAIRANDGTIPQALRYKFAIDNDMLEGFEGMTTKKIGILAVKSDVCGDDTLEIGKTYTKDGKVTEIKDVEVTEDNIQPVSGDSANKYITVALYNIGKKGNNVDYSAYGSDYSVRPYIIYADANGVENVVYGNTVDANVFNVMLAIFSENKSESDIEIAKGLLAKEEISKEYYKWQPTDNWYLGESQASDYAYSFAVIGDIQKTTRKFPDKLHYIYDWILENKDSKNIQYAMSMGDLTDANTAAEWDRATEQHDRLQQAGLNQSIVRGNHDQVKGFDANITAEKYGDGLYSTFNGMRNTCRRVTISGVKYMVITLDLYPSDDEVAWAEELIVNNPDYNVILTTHAYFKNVSGKGKIELETSIRTDFVSNKLAEGQVAADLNSGQEIFDKLVNKYSNIVLVLCGHNDPYDDGPNHRITTREDGSQVVEMMTNFQDMEDRTNRSYGMLAMLYIKEDGTVQLEYFSTINGMFFKDKFQFEFNLDLVD